MGTLIILIIFLLNTQLIIADRGLMPIDGTVQIYEPGQKAIIAWNGTEEILILATDVYGDDSTQVLEVIPLPSLPRIELGNITSFKAINRLIYKYYDENPLGTAVIHNWEKSPATDIKATVFIRHYMDIPKECTVQESLESGEEVAFDLNALFNNNVLGITEGTKAAAEITITYKQNGTDYKNSYSETIRIFDRNAITWDDDRKAAAFVTAKDPAILKFSKNVVGATLNKGSKAIDKHLLTAMALHEAISLYGMTYIIDPTTPYIEFSTNTQAVDFLQFPKQTLEYKAGDCDDLSILYSALLESVGIETAFITIPGHILMAFAVKMDADAAKKRFSNHDDLIFKDEKAWIPVEITEIDGGFLRAWEVGAQEWREASLNLKAGFYPMHSSWKLYEPVGLPGDASSIFLPDSNELVSKFLTELIVYIDKEIYPQKEKIDNDIRKYGKTAKLLNRRGVLYAKYGLNDEAEAEFNNALMINNNYMPALMNLGNIYYLRDEMDMALNLYGQARSVQPENPKVLLSIARASYELNDFESAKESYRKMKKIDPNLAVQYAYIEIGSEDSVRASDRSGMKDAIIWEEEF